MGMFFILTALQVLMSCQGFIPYKPSNLPVFTDNTGGSKLLSPSKERSTSFQSTDIIMPQSSGFMVESGSFSLDTLNSKSPGFMVASGSSKPQGFIVAPSSSNHDTLNSGSEPQGLFFQSMTSGLETHQPLPLQSVVQSKIPSQLTSLESRKSSVPRIAGSPLNNSSNTIVKQPETTKATITVHTTSSMIVTTTNTTINTTTTTTTARPTEDMTTTEDIGSTTEYPPDCKDGFTFEAGLCYKIISNMFYSRKKAQSMCEKEAQGGRLVQLKTIEQFVALRSALQVIDGFFPYYVGLKRDNNSTMVWDDGSAVMEEFWAPGEPSSRKQKCGDMRYDHKFMLNDGSCDILFANYICEKPW